MSRADDLLRKLVEHVNAPNERGEPIIGEDHTGAVNWLIDFAAEAERYLNRVAGVTEESCLDCGKAILCKPDEEKRCAACLVPLRSELVDKTGVKVKAGDRVTWWYATRLRGDGSVHVLPFQPGTVVETQKGLRVRWDDGNTDEPGDIGDDGLRAWFARLLVEPGAAPLARVQPDEDGGHVAAAMKAFDVLPDVVHRDIVATPSPAGFAAALLDLWHAANMSDAVMGMEHFTEWSGASKDLLLGAGLESDGDDYRLPPGDRQRMVTRALDLLGKLVTRVQAMDERGELRIAKDALGTCVWLGDFASESERYLAVAADLAAKERDRILEEAARACDKEAQLARERGLQAPDQSNGQRQGAEWSAKAIRAMKSRP